MDGNTWVELRQRARELARWERRARKDSKTYMIDPLVGRVYAAAARRERARIERQLAKLDAPLGDK